MKTRSFAAGTCLVDADFRLCHNTEIIHGKGWCSIMKPLQISADTAVKLAKALNVPLEQLMHTPPHILMQKLAELSKREAEEQNGETT